MKRTVQNDTFSINDSVVVKNSAHPYHNKEGKIVRFGEAGDVNYIIVKLEGVNTLITFTEKDIIHGK